MLPYMQRSYCQLRKKAHFIYDILTRTFRGTMNRNITLIMGIFYGIEEREEGHLIKKGEGTC
jgi:hypothetical protein